MNLRVEIRISSDHPDTWPHLGPDASTYTPTGKTPPDGHIDITRLAEAIADGYIRIKERAITHTQLGFAHDQTDLELVLPHMIADAANRTLDQLAIHPTPHNPTKITTDPNTTP